MPGGSRDVRREVLAVASVVGGGANASAVANSARVFI